MLAAEPAVSTEESSLGSPTALLGFESQELVPTPRTRPRPDKFGRVHSRAQLRARLEAAHYQSFRTAYLETLPLPSRFDLESLLSRFRASDRIKPNRELRRRIDDEAVTIIESIAGVERARSLTGLKAVVDSFKTELNAVRRRTRLLARQRVNQYTWAMHCMLRGQVSTTLEAPLSAAYFWELLQHWAVEQILIPTTDGSAQRASSRRELDSAVRGFRSAFRDIVLEADSVQRDRERVLLLVDIWNSSELERIYTPKDWNAAAAPAGELSLLLRQLHSSTIQLERVLLDRFGEAQLADRLAPEGAELPIARDLFAGLVDEEAA